ncbi:hypothetical protein WAC38_28935, partial [Klebsiella pneumoniae]|uniref:hypothetical protein n=1 Tax=Klebsiella pneumoniae TaxID=573 RepID=UPI0030131947
AIFGSDPIPDSARIEDIEKKKEVKLVQQLTEDELIEGIRGQLNKLSYRTAYQVKSFEEINNMVKNKAKLLDATPSIQPVSNRNLS